MLRGDQLADAPGGGGTGHYRPQRQRRLGASPATQVRSRTAEHQLVALTGPSKRRIALERDPGSREPQQYLRPRGRCFVCMMDATRVRVQSGRSEARFEYCLLYTSPSPRDS